jgi:hypothetical protein
MVRYQKLHFHVKCRKNMARTNFGNSDLYGHLFGVTDPRKLGCNIDIDFFSLTPGGNRFQRSAPLVFVIFV